MADPPPIAASTGASSLDDQRTSYWSCSGALIAALSLLWMFGWVPWENLKQSLSHPTDLARPVGAVATPLRSVPDVLDPLPQDPATTSGFSLVLQPGMERVGLRLEIPCPPDYLPGLVGHLETTGPARLHLDWGEDATGPPVALLSGRNVELWATTITARSRSNNIVHRVTLVASLAPGQSPTTAPVTVVADLNAQRAHGAKAWPLLVNDGWALSLVVVVYCWYALLFQLLTLYGSARSTKNPAWPVALLSIVFLLLAVLLVDNLLTVLGDQEGAMPYKRTALSQAMLLSGFMLALLLGRKVPLGRWGWPTYCALACLTLVPGLVLRWDWLLIVQQVRLQADAQGYLEIALWMTLPWDGLYREPFFPLLLKMWFAVWEPGPLQARLLTVMLSLVLGMTLMIFLRPIFNRVWQVGLIGLLFSFHTLLAHSAAMGLREELVPLLILLMILAIPAKEPGDWRRWIVPGVVGGLLVLTRINLLTVIVPLALAAGWWAWSRPERQRWLAGLGVMVCIVLAMQLPNSIALALRYGDPMHTSNKHATWYRNAEFAGQPGHITRVEFAANGYAGTQVTWGEYLLGMHSLRDLTTGTLAGLYGFTLGDPARNTLFRFSTEPVVQTEYYTVAIGEGKQRWWEWALMLAGTIGWLRGLIWPGVALRVRLAAWVLLLFLLPLAPLQGWGLLPDRLLFTMMPLYLVVLADLVAAATECWRRFFRPTERVPNDEERVGPPIVPARVPV